MKEEYVEYPIKAFLPSKKTQRNYHKFLKDLNKIQNGNYEKG